MEAFYSYTEKSQFFNAKGKINGTFQFLVKYVVLHCKKIKHTVLL